MKLFLLFLLSIGTTIGCELMMCERIGRPPIRVACLNAESLLAQGYFFPSSIIDGIHFDEQCDLVDRLPSCTPQCSCPPEMTECYSEQCSDLCPNGGLCRTNTRSCLCYPCDYGSYA